MSSRATGPATVTVTVLLKPNSREAGVVGDGPALRVSVKSPPVDGRANAEAAALLARAFGVPKSHVALTRGARARKKRFEITEPLTIPTGFRGD
jgi:uncharacterized protein